MIANNTTRNSTPDLLISLAFIVIQSEIFGVSNDARIWHIKFKCEGNNAEKVQ